MTISKRVLHLFLFKKLPLLFRNLTPRDSSSIIALWIRLHSMPFSTIATLRLGQQKDRSDNKKILYNSIGRPRFGLKIALKYLWKVYTFQVCQCQSVKFYVVLLIRDRLRQLYPQVTMPSQVIQLGVVIKYSYL